MLHRSTIATSACLAVAALIAAGSLASDAFAEYPVGTSNVTFVDSARGNRSIPVDLYYPAQSAGAGQPVADPPLEGFPAVAFGHGFQIAAANYAWIAARLAGEGCVVAVPRTAGELFPDHEAFGLDLAFAARSLRDAGADPASPFFGRMGPRTLVMGHSMGGGCSMLAAGGDTSITAVANFAAAETNPSAVTACGLIDRPALVFAGGNDCVTPPADHQIPMYEALTGWRTLVTIDGASHCQFNSYSFLCDFGESCSAGISREAQQDLVWLLLKPWMRAILFLDSTALRDFFTLLEAGAGFTYEQDGVPTGAEARVPPVACRLSAFPNPFNASIMLRAEIAAGGPARLVIFDAGGRRVRVIVERSLAAGPHTFHWDGRTDARGDAPSGIYFARLSGSGGTTVAKLVLVR